MITNGIGAVGVDSAIRNMLTMTRWSKLEVPKVVSEFM